MLKNRHLGVSLGLMIASTLAFGQSGIGPITSGVPNANPSSGHPGTVITRGFALKTLAVGSDLLENPSGVITSLGFLNDFPPQAVEPTKTEPDQNLYVVFSRNPGGPTGGYNYGHHFLYQPHESPTNNCYLTRINLDVTDPAHRITLLTPVGADGLTHFSSADGSTFNPFTRTLLFTMETGSPNGGVIEITTSWPPETRRLDGVFGSGGFEGIHPDDRGNILVIEDAGGTSVNVVQNDATTPKVARQPNSFVYRLVPYDKRDLSKGGKLQALQVSIDGKPVVFSAADPVGDVFSDNQLKLHTLGTSYPVRWVTVHDTAVDGTDSFNANAAAKAAGATPFKRPENTQFLPGSGFRTFFFTPTGDTNSDAGNQPALAARGSWGSIFRVDLRESRNSGRISIFALGDADHAAFDNIAFADKNTVLVGEDRGDGLHNQLNKLDSVWAYPLNGSTPKRFVALGRDPASELDASLLGTSGFQNEGDNETTGLHVSNGSTSVEGLLGTTANLVNARGFLTRQHGENEIWEIVKTRRGDD